MVMKFSLLPWKPELVFTGLSIMGVNPQNLKFCSHVVISLSFLLAFHSVSIGTYAVHFIAQWDLL
jgi:hypothetical protein